MTAPLIRNHPHGYVDSEGAMHAVAWWGEEYVVTRSYDAEFVWRLDGTNVDDEAEGLTLQSARPAEPAPKRSGWVNVYWVSVAARTVFAPWHETKEAADKKAGPDRIACVPFTEGDGL